MYYLSCILINVLNILWYIQCPRFKLMYFFLFYLIFAFRFLNHDVLPSSLLMFNVRSHKSWQILTAVVSLTSLYTDLLEVVLLAHLHAAFIPADCLSVYWNSDIYVI